MTPLRLGLVGAGAVAELHAAAARAMPEHVRVSAVVDPRREVAQRLADVCDAVTAADHRELARGGVVDAVIVASPHAVHCSQVVDLAAAGLPVLVEKPMALTVDACDRMIGAALQHDVTMVVGHLQRYLPSVSTASRMLREGAVGEPRLILERRGARYERGTRPDWFLDPRGGLGGILTNLGSHCFDKLFQLTGSRTARVRSAWTSGEGVVTEVAAMVDLDPDIRANVVLTGTGLPDVDVTEVIGTEGALRLSRDRGVELYGNGRVVHRVPQEPGDVAAAFVAQLRDFHDAVTGRAAAVVDGHYGRDVVAALENVAVGAAQPDDTTRKDTHA